LPGADPIKSVTISVSGDNFFESNKQVDFSIAAIPETSTWAMMLLGFAGLGYVAFRGRAKFGAGIV
jgi:hypothetical protein